MNGQLPCRGGDRLSDNRQWQLRADLWQLLHGRLYAGLHLRGRPRRVAQHDAGRAGVQVRLDLERVGISPMQRRKRYGTHGWCGASGTFWVKKDALGSEGKLVVHGVTKR